MAMLLTASVRSRRSLVVNIAPADRAASNIAAPGNTARPMTWALLSWSIDEEGQVSINSSPDGQTKSWGLAA